MNQRKNKRRKETLGEAVNIFDFYYNKFKFQLFSSLFYSFSSPLSLSSFSFSSPTSFSSLFIYSSSFYSIINYSSFYLFPYLNHFFTSSKLFTFLSSTSQWICGPSKSFNFLMNLSLF